MLLPSLLSTPLRSPDVSAGFDFLAVACSHPAPCFVRLAERFAYVRMRRVTSPLLLLDGRQGKSGHLLCYVRQGKTQ